MYNSYKFILIIALIGLVRILFFLQKEYKKRRIYNANYFLTSIIWRTKNCIQKEYYKMQYEYAKDFLNSLGYEVYIYENNQVKIESSKKKFKPALEQGALYISKIYWKLKEEPENKEYQFQYDTINEIATHIGYHIIIHGDTGISLEEIVSNNKTFNDF